MTQNEMIKRIQEAVSIHQLNHAAVKATNLPEGFEPTVVAAMRKSLEEELTKIFQKGYQ